jgi:hypothetical protein
VYKVNSPEEFFNAYDQSRDLCMTLQRGVNFKEYFRCYVVGQEKVHIMHYDPSLPMHERYVKNPPPTDPKLLERVHRDCLTLCRALGYDLNTVEFACEDGIPYAIDFMNPAPDADVNSVGQKNFDWIVNNVAELAVRKAKEHTGQVSEYRWSAFLNGQTHPSKSSLSGPPSPGKTGLDGAPAARPSKKSLDGPSSKTDSAATPDSSKPGTMLEAASKQLRKRATKG